MALYADEEEIWKCPIPKHSSKRRRTGVCPSCLKDRLNALCPDCANVRPCVCCTASSSSSSSSSSSRSSAVGRLSNIIDSEPSFRRSLSVAVPFLRSKHRDAAAAESGNNRSKPSFWWSAFRFSKSKSKRFDEGREAEEVSSWMMRSRSVSVPNAAPAGESRSTRSKGWYFPSPMKVFRSTKTSATVVHKPIISFV